jgi:hypothetical protein
MDINLNELAECNKLGKKWAKLAGYKPTKYFSFISDLMVNLDVLQEKLRDKFADLLAAKDTILLPAKYQNFLCSKHEKAVKFWAIKFKSNYVSMDERISYGYEGIWRAIFAYTKPECSLESYIFHNVRMHIRASITHEINKYKATKRSIFNTAVRLESAKDKDNPLNFADPRVVNPSVLAESKESKSEEIILDEWLDRANITDEENRRIVHFYIRREEFVNNGWVDKYLEDLNARKGITRSKPGIRQRLDRVKEILAFFAA